MWWGCLGTLCSRRRWSQNSSPVLLVFLSLHCNVVVHQSKWICISGSSLLILDFMASSEILCEFLMIHFLLMCKAQKSWGSPWCQVSRIKKDNLKQCNWYTLCRKEQWHVDVSAYSSCTLFLSLDLSLNIKKEEPAEDGKLTNTFLHVCYWQCSSPCSRGSARIWYMGRRIKKWKSK